MQLLRISATMQPNDNKYQYILILVNYLSHKSSSFAKQCSLQFTDLQQQFKQSKQKEILRMGVENQLSEMGSMGGMSMSTITWSADCVIFLFDAFHAKTTIQFIVGCIGVFLLSVFSQMLNLPMFKDFMIGSTTKNKRQNNTTNDFEIGNGIDSDRQTNEMKISQHIQKSTKNEKQTMSLIFKIRMTLFYSLNALLSLLLMLIAMTMNGYVILSVAVGMGFGKTVISIFNQSAKQSYRVNQHKQQIDANCCQM